MSVQSLLEAFWNLVSSQDPPCLGASWTPSRSTTGLSLKASTLGQGIPCRRRLRCTILVPVVTLAWVDAHVSRSAGDNSVDTELCSETSGQGRCFTLAAGTFSIRAVQEGTRALQLSSSAQSQRSSTFMEKKPAGLRLSKGLLQTMWEEWFSWTGSQSLLGEAEDRLA